MRTPRTAPPALAHATAPAHAPAPAPAHATAPAHAHATAPAQAQAHATASAPAPPTAPKLADDQPRAIHLAEMLRGLAHPLRLRIVSALCDGPMNVTEIHTKLGVKQNLVSQHLSTLRLLGLVKVDRVASTATYSLREEGLRDLVGCLSRCQGSR